MKKTFSLLTMMFGLTGAFAQEYNHQNLKIMEVAPASHEAPAMPEQFDVRYTTESLRLFPIMASETFIQETRDLGKFTLLKDAIETDKIRITETGAAEPNMSNLSHEVAGTVNTLLAHNTSKDTIFIMAGEVVKGGKQDRVIAQDLVLLPGEEVNLSAFCVEASRWTTKDNNGGKFTGYFNFSSMDIRKTVVTEQDQQSVWNKVDVHTATNQATSDTRTYTNLANSEAYQTALQKYLDELGKAFDGNTRVVGVIAVTGDRVMGMDVFATHELFISAYPNLLHSYASEAITHGEPVRITNEEVYHYLDKLLSANEQQEQMINENGNVYKYKERKVHMSYY